MQESCYKKLHECTLQGKQPPREIEGKPQFLLAFSMFFVVFVLEVRYYFQKVFLSSYVLIFFLKILGNTKLPLYGRNILRPKLMKLTLVARKIIVHNSSQPGSMADDLRNSPLQ